MINLLRRCENCVNSKKNENNSITCIPQLPYWVTSIINNHTVFALALRVANDTAECCPAFRLRDIGENHNV
jgi:hypothetical protein